MDHVLAAQADGAALHVMGLLSDGGVHSHIDHLFAIIDMAKEKGIENLCIHCFLDGRDVPPRCAEKYIKELEDYMQETGLGRIASIAGRYYAMDRDNRWDRVQKVHDALTSPTVSRHPHSRHQPSKPSLARRTRAAKMTNLSFLQ